MASIHETKCARSAPKNECLNIKMDQGSIFTIRHAENTTKAKKAGSQSAKQRITILNLTVPGRGQDGL